MGWWTDLFRRESKLSHPNDRYQVACVLYSEDGKRAVEVREFTGGQTYLLESERAEGGHFAERHEGRLVGPFDSAAHAERFVTATPWFTGAARSRG